MKRKLLLMLCCFFLCVSIAGCGGGVDLKEVNDVEGVTFSVPTDWRLEGASDTLIPIYSYSASPGDEEALNGRFSVCNEYDYTYYTSPVEAQEAGIEVLEDIYGDLLVQQTTVDGEDATIVRYQDSELEGVNFATIYVIREGRLFEFTYMANTNETNLIDEEVLFGSIKFE